MSTDDRRRMRASRFETRLLLQVSEAFGQSASFRTLHGISGDFRRRFHGVQGVPSSNLGAPTNLNLSLPTSHRTAKFSAHAVGRYPCFPGGCFGYPIPSRFRIDVLQDATGGAESLSKYLASLLRYSTNHLSDTPAGLSKALACAIPLTRALCVSSRSRVKGASARACQSVVS